MRPGLTITTRQEQAAVLVAADERTDAQIAADCRIGKATLERWKLRADFQERVAYHRDLWRKKVETQGIADRANRVKAANERWRKLQRVIEERAEDPAVDTVPGGSTGLLVKTIKVVGNGPSAYEVDEWSVDTALLKSLLEHEKQTAQDLGQWTEKVAPTTPDGTKEYASESRDAIRAAEIAYLKALGIEAGKVETEGTGVLK